VKEAVQFRAEFFNVWKWHNFSCENQCYGETASKFNQLISDPTFEMWDGRVTPPRNIQYTATHLGPLPKLARCDHS